jgi:hypothetical protein
MSWIAIVFWVVTHLPEMVGILESIVKLIESVGHPQAETLRSNLSDLIAKGDVSGVKSAIEGAQGMVPSAPQLVN